MGHLPPKLKAEILSDPFYRTCARAGLFEHECAGRITFEHAIIYAGKQLNKKWAVIPLCAKAHNVDTWMDCGDMDKKINEWIAIERATDAELLEISRARDYFQYRHFLEGEYGVYNPVQSTGNNAGIDYGQRGDKSSDIHR